jgi:collagenase-like PrtC family protease
MNFSIASNWDDDLLEELNKININGKEDKIVELFGSSAYSLLGSANAGLPEVKKEEIENKIKKAHSLGFKFNYLINSFTYPEIKTDLDFAEVINYLKWLMATEVDSITIANEKILKLVSENFPELKINVSIVMGVKNVDKVNYLRRLYPNIQRVILHHTVNRDRDQIIAHVRNSKNKIGSSGPVEIELLANRSALS